MSFDIHCMFFKNGRKAVADAEAARRVLNGTDFRLVKGFAEDCFQLEFKDRSHVELYATGINGGCKLFDSAMFILHGGSWSPSVMKFIFDFAAATRFAIVPQSPPKVIVPFEDVLAELPPGFTDDFQPVVISGGEDLGHALSSDDGKVSQ